MIPIKFMKSLTSSSKEYKILKKNLEQDNRLTIIVSNTLNVDFFREV
ncbi:hypothetical protein Emtol_1221 [Emticicia oligotrophica DSM 17448]|uniref:Uncharacterized protein n=1 Tax=Emticicia oligotrophica (strain DSM 17448 / CIP 109782 / MTCC 6937 / GPTSA100-15) TaxID=929562 RepID=A0ABN4AJV9_EMTOG|nr:hypothetical protein Emtol_1221 [Emticicia oligotrophica DSM 17448]